MKARELVRQLENYIYLHGEDIQVRVEEWTDYGLEYEYDFNITFDPISRSVDIEIK